MNAEKVKQYIALFGGWLSAFYLFLKDLGIQLGWFNEVTISSFINLLTLSIPFILLFYGVYKNSYVITKEAKEQETELKKKGLK